VIRCPKQTEAVDRLVALLHSADRKLTGVKDNETHLLDERDVFYIESVDKRCFLYTAAAVYETPLKLYQLEERLADAGFVRSAKAQILCIAHIRSLRPDFGGRILAVMENGEHLIVSRQYAKALKERLGLK